MLSNIFCLSTSIKLGPGFWFWWIYEGALHRTLIFWCFVLSLYTQWSITARYVTSESRSLPSTIERNTRCIKYCRSEDRWGQFCILLTHTFLLFWGRDTIAEPSAVHNELSLLTCIRAGIVTDTNWLFFLLTLFVYTLFCSGGICRCRFWGALTDLFNLIQGTVLA